MENTQENNIAFIDGQNLHFGTTKCNDCAKKLEKELRYMSLEDCSCGSAWEIELSKLRIYLKDNYKVSEAYYFLGFLQDKNTDLYNKIQKAGFIVSFKEHKELFLSKKKGNVDSDIILEVMKLLIDAEDNFSKIVMVSGDGDYKKLIDYLISKDRFKKILFPNRKFASSLYDELGSERFDYLENLKSYIE